MSLLNDYIWDFIEMHGPNILKNTCQGNSMTLNRVVASKKFYDTKFGSKSGFKEASEKISMENRQFWVVFRFDLQAFSDLNHKIVTPGWSRVGHMRIGVLSTYLGQSWKSIFHHYADSSSKIHTLKKKVLYIYIYIYIEKPLYCDTWTDNTQ